MVSILFVSAVHKIAFGAI